MKLPILIASALLPLIAGATPDRCVSVTEVFLGANASEYAVLRTEIDNLGSYYRGRRKTWLDVFPKSAKPDAKPSSTLILDEDCGVDVDTGKPLPPTEHFKDTGLTLADVVSRFPLRTLTAWPVEWRKELKFDEKTARTMFKSQCMVEGKDAFGDRFGSSAEDSPFQLVDVAEDGDCVYLTIRKGVDEGDQTRILCVPAAASRNARALMRLEPVYLSAGAFKTKDDAFAKVGELQPQPQPGGYSTWEVWAAWREDTRTTEFEVVLADSTSRINDLRMMTDRNEFPVHLVPVTSQGFRERLSIPPPEMSSRKKPTP